jgi:hypothetical protein
MQFDRNSKLSEAARRSSKILNRLPTVGARRVVIAAGGLVGAISAWAAHRAISYMRHRGDERQKCNSAQRQRERKCRKGVAGRWW